MPKNFKTKFYLAIIAIILFCFIVLFIRQKANPMPEYNIPTAQIGQTIIKVELAADSRSRRQGLAGRLSLAAEQGMYFSYSDYKIRIFTMSGMNFPLDIIWIKDNQIVGWAENLAPIPDFLVSSKVEVNGVLEVKAGFINKNQLKIGDQFKLLAP